MLGVSEYFKESKFDSRALHIVLVLGRGGTRRKEIENGGEREQGE